MENKCINRAFIHLPTGIDVEVAVEHNGIRQRCSLGENVTPTPRSNASPAPTSPAKEPESSAASVASVGSVHMEVQTEEAAEPKTQIDKDVEVMDIASPAPAEASQAPGEHSGSPDPEDWMLVNQESSEPASAAGTRPKTPPIEEKQVSYPSLAELTPHPGEYGVWHLFSGMSFLIDTKRRQIIPSMTEIIVML